MVASDFLPSLGGIQTHTLAVSRALRRRGVDVAVITRHWPGLARSELIEGVPVFRVGASGRGRTVGTAAYIAGALRVLAREPRRFTVVHAQQMLSPTTIGILARTALGIRLVVNPHLSGPDGDVGLLSRRGALLGRSRLAAAAATADAFLSISRPIRDELTGAGVSSKLICDIPNGVDANRFAPVGQPERAALRAELDLPDGPLVLFAGRLVRQKGVDVVLAAWPRVLAALPSARLLVVGDGPERTTLEGRAAALGVGSSVRFAGAVGDVAPYLRAADAFVLASRAEGLPVALLEAMSTSLRVVASAVGGSGELIEDGVTGRLVPPDDSPALARAIVESLGPAGRTWGAAARTRVLARYSMERVADEYLGLYARLSAGASVSISPPLAA